MKYIALLRGINVGGHNKVDMKRLKVILETNSLKNIDTYLNTGNIMFESTESLDNIYSDFSKILYKELGFNIPILIKEKSEIVSIVDAVPKDWLNNKEQKTDVAFLFPEIDNVDIIPKIPINHDYVSKIYTKGALIWHILKKDYNKSQLNKLVSKKIYKLMTIRNINTARHLAEL